MTAAVGIGSFHEQAADVPPHQPKRQMNKRPRPAHQRPELKTQWKIESF
jgi:hypothetical protein